MTKWIRKETIKDCPVHTAIREEASKLLSEKGTFSKSEVITITCMKSVADAVRWDYIRELIEEDQGCELIPLASSFFNRHTASDEQKHPERYMAMGHGKKTAGYAAVTLQNEHFVVKKLEHRHAVANGVGRAFDAYLDQVQQKRISNTSQAQLTARN